MQGRHWIVSQNTDWWLGNLGFHDVMEMGFWEKRGEFAEAMEIPDSSLWLWILSVICQESQNSKGLPRSSKLSVHWKKPISLEEDNYGRLPCNYHNWSWGSFQASWPESLKGEKLLPVINGFHVSVFWLAFVALKVATIFHRLFSCTLHWQ